MFLSKLSRKGSKMETEFKLDDLCRNCGEKYGLHRKGDNACPLRDDLNPQRIVAYRDDSAFEKWEDHV